MFAYKTIIAVVFACVVLGGSETGLFAGSDEARRKLGTDGLEISPLRNSMAVVWKDGEKYMDIDFRPFENPAYRNEFPPSLGEALGRQGLHPLSPDGRYIPILRTDRDILSLIAVDLVRKTVTSQQVSKSFHISQWHAVEWVTSSKFLLHAIPNGYLYDLENPSTSRPLINEYGLSWDAGKENSVSVYGKSYHHMGGTRALTYLSPLAPSVTWETYRPDTDHVERKSTALSEAVKYNGRFVYPVEAHGFPGEWTYPAMSALAPHAEPDPKYPNLQYSDVAKTVKESGMLLPLVHIFSEPTFVANTPWMASLEQVYEPGRLDHQIGCNLLLIDAHAVSALPPKPGEVRVVKQPLDPLVPKSPAQYENMVDQIVTTYDTTSKTLEIWRPTNGLRIYEIPIEMKNAADGTFEPQIGQPIFFLKEKEYPIPDAKNGGGPV